MDTRLLMLLGSGMVVDDEWSRTAHGGYGLPVATVWRRRLPPPHQPSPALLQAQGTCSASATPPQGGVITPALPSGRDVAGMTKGWKCCRSGGGDRLTTGHHPTLQQILRQPRGFLRMTVCTNVSWIHFTEGCRATCHSERSRRISRSIRRQCGKYAR